MLKEYFYFTRGERRVLLLLLAVLALLLLYRCIAPRLRTAAADEAPPIVQNEDFVRFVGEYTQEESPLDE